jgi:hypothetical protein
VSEDGEREMAVWIDLNGERFPDIAASEGKDDH